MPWGVSRQRLAKRQRVVVGGTVSQSHAKVCKPRAGRETGESDRRARERRQQTDGGWVGGWLAAITKQGPDVGHERAGIEASLELLNTASSSVPRAGGFIVGSTACRS